jgi:TRAP-type mannitol/chloroaromatic compound transport system substrate-binding protein
MSIGIHKIGRRQFLAGVGAAGAGILASPAIAQSGTPIKWRMPGILPSGDWNYASCERLRDLVAAMSGGRLMIEVFPAGQLVGAAEVFDAVRSGLFEGGFYAGSYKGGLDTIFNIEWGIPVGAVPVRMQDMWTLYHERGLEQVFQDAYREQGIELAGQIWTGHYVGVTKFPVSSVSDLAGKKVRTVGAAALTLNKLNVPTVFLPVPEIYTALAAGTIDGAWFGPAPVYSALKMHEVATHLILPSLVSPTSLSVLTAPRAWDALPPDLQEIFTQAVRLVSAWNYSRANADTISAAAEMRDKGMTIVNFKGEDLAALEEAGRSVWAEMPGDSAHSKRAQVIIDDFMVEFRG